MVKSRAHPAEVAAEAQMISAIRNADYFIASLFVGTGKYEKMRGKTIKDAFAAGNKRVEELRSARRPILYAIGPDGRATMLTMALISRLLSFGSSARP